MRARAYRLHLANVATGELAFLLGGISVRIKPRQMSEVDKRCIYARSEHLKMINLFISYGITEDNVSSLMIGLWDGVAKKAKSLIFKCERKHIG